MANVIVYTRIAKSDNEGLIELVEQSRYKNVSGAIEQAIRNLLGKEGVAHCRYCGKMRILNIDGLCLQCAQAKASEAGT